MNPLRALIVDDEPLARRRLQLILETFDREIEVVGQADGCDSAVAAITRLAPDVVLLDFKMRDGDGFEVLARIPPHRRPEVIFVTAFQDAAVQAFEQEAADYLLKPVESARLIEAFGRARRRIDARAADEQIGELRLILADLRSVSPQPTLRYEQEFWIRGRPGVVTRVDVDAIAWVSIEDDYVRLHTPTGSHLMRETIQGILARLGPERFVRVHRATLVNVALIESFKARRGSGTNVVLRGGTILRVGRVYARALTARFGSKHSVESN